MMTSCIVFSERALVIVPRISLPDFSYPRFWLIGASRIVNRGHIDLSCHGEGAHAVLKADFMWGRVEHCVCPEILVLGLVKQHMLCKLTQGRCVVETHFHQAEHGDSSDPPVRLARISH